MYESVFRREINYLTMKINYLTVKTNYPTAIVPVRY